MKLFIGADHQGFELKAELIKLLKEHGYEIEDEGDDVLKPDDDFPLFAEKVVRAMQSSGENDARGILICGSGQGMCMAANRFKGIRACLGYNRESARASRNDEDSNVLCLPASVLRGSEAQFVVHAWLETPFAGSARFVRRNQQLDELG